MQTNNHAFHRVMLAIIPLSMLGAFNLYADEQRDARYLLQPGDQLHISVWREADLNTETIILPDGRISFPLVGEIHAAGHNIMEVRKMVSAGLTKYIPDPVVTVSATQLSGNKIYVIGKVNRPGELPISRNIDVMQALSMAGGTSTYAALNKIKILRRDKNGRQSAIKFEYGDIEKGKNLEQNIILEAGDTVVVP